MTLSILNLNSVFLLLFVGFTIISCKREDDSKKASEASSKYGTNLQLVERINFNQFEDYLHKADDSLYIINFWATWCKPCVEELPHFEKINSTYSNTNVKVILVSLDMPNMLEGHVIPFVRKHNLNSQILLLDDPNRNFWISKIDQEWTGAIPATLVYKKDKREFFETPFTYNELNNVVSRFLKD